MRDTSVQVYAPRKESLYLRADAKTLEWLFAQILADLSAEPQPQAESLGPSPPQAESPLVSDHEAEALVQRSSDNNDASPPRAKRPSMSSRPREASARKRKTAGKEASVDEDEPVREECLAELRAALPRGEGRVSWVPSRKSFCVTFGDGQRKHFPARSLERKRKRGTCEQAYLDAKGAALIFLFSKDLV